MTNAICKFNKESHKMTFGILPSDLCYITAFIEM